MMAQRIDKEAASEFFNNRKRGRFQAYRPAQQQVSATTARRLLKILYHIGIDPAEIMRRAGLKSSAASIAANHISGLSHEKFCAFYAQSILAIEAHANKEHGRLSLEWNEFRLLCYCIIICPTLRDTITRATEFLAMLSPRCGVLHLSENRGIAELELRTRRQSATPSAFLSDITGLSAFHRLFSWMIGRPIELLSVETAYDHSFENWQILNHFSLPLNFNGNKNSFRFQSDFLNLNIIKTPDELSCFLKFFPFEINEPSYSLHQISEQIKSIYINSMLYCEPIPSIRSFSRQFNQSVSTFRRRLSDEGTSLRQIKEECRKSLAVDLLKQKHLSLSEIAMRLGFVDEASFRRAFKSWFGTPPTAFRNRNVPQCIPARLEHSEPQHLVHLL